MQSGVKRKILCIGEILWDLLPGGPKVGGAPLNVALHLKNFGFEVKFAGRIGNDKLGRDLKKFLERQGLATDLLQIDYELPTSTVNVQLDSDSNVKFEINDNVAWDRIELTEELRITSAEAEVIVFGTLASRHDYSRETICRVLEMNNGCLKLLDINLRPPHYTKEIVEKLIKASTIVKLNIDEIKIIAGWHNKKFTERELLGWFLEKYDSQMVCVTLGSDGAMVLDKYGHFFIHPGFKVNVTDPVGAGDAFLAGFLSNCLRGGSLYSSLEYACALGALVASKPGATPVYQLDEIQDIIKSYYSII